MTHVWQSNFLIPCKIRFVFYTHDVCAYYGQNKSKINISCSAQNVLYANYSSNSYIIFYVICVHIINNLFADFIMPFLS